MWLERRNPSYPTAHRMVYKCIGKRPKTVTSADWQNHNTINIKGNLVLVMLAAEVPKT